MKQGPAFLTVRGRLLTAFAVVIALSVVLLFFSLRTISTITSHKTTNEKLEALEVTFSKQELLMKEFLYEGFKENSFQEKGSSRLSDSLRDAGADVIALLDFLSGHAPRYSSQWNGVRLLSREIALAFDSVQAYLKIRGFKDFGLEGSLRAAVHAVENSGGNFSKEKLLTLRRNEKDFFLRKDVKYVSDFTKNAAEFRQSLSGADLQELTDRYVSEFLKVADIEAKIGLKPSDGLRGKLKQQIDQTRPLLAKIKAEVTTANQQQIARARLVLILLFFAQLLAGALVAVLYSNVLTRAIREIRDALQKLAAGSFPEKLPVKTAEEIGQMRDALNQLVDRIAEATRFAETLGSGNLRAKYSEQFKDDVLAKAIVRMQEKMIEADNAQAKINWTNRGLARFSDILKDDSLTLAALGDALLSMLVNYLGANQAALFIKEGDCLERLSTYAYGKKRFAEGKIPLGNGLAGQCALEGQTIYLTEVPQQYVKITSGLGEATPGCLVLVPLKKKEEIFGILELASFEPFTPVKIEFLEKIAENMAALISGRQANDLTRRLLDESRQKAETLAQQEEEMRQNTEELQATQEQLERQRSEMQEEIRLLRGQLQMVHADAMEMRG
jgi:HAMP domain-containing protein/putative methionine-R-sulfoxide reductase with GAF domain